MKITNPFAVLSTKYDTHPHIVAWMECRHMGNRTMHELRDLVGKDVQDPITIEKGTIVSFDGPCMADDCQRPRDPDPRFENHCCRPIYTVQYPGRQEIHHLDELYLITNEGMQNCSLPW